MKLKIRKHQILMIYKRTTGYMNNWITFDMKSIELLNVRAKMIIDKRQNTNNIKEYYTNYGMVRERAWGVRWGCHLKFCNIELVVFLLSDMCFAYERRQLICNVWVSVGRAIVNQALIRYPFHNTAGALVVWGWMTISLIMIVAVTFHKDFMMKAGQIYVAA